MYTWLRAGEFLNREVELARLEEWWEGPERMPINLYGRRRVGKSWLFRRFANGKPALILVAERLAEGSQMQRFAAQIGAFTEDGIQPDVGDVSSLFRTIYRLSRRGKILVVIDEFPLLLGTTQAAVDRTLSGIQAVIEEERDGSRLKLIVCGSAIGQMEALQGAANPLHGRLIPLEVRPIKRLDAPLFLPGNAPDTLFTRYTISGGMPRYLAALASGSIEAAVCREILRPDAPLWNEGRTIVQQELAEPGTHFSILEQLATGDKRVGEVGAAMRTPAKHLSPYLAKLERLRLVERTLPFGAPPTRRDSQWRLSDPFLRFWFRFVFPFQAELEAGLDPVDLFRGEIKPDLSHFVSPAFEDAARNHARMSLGSLATRVGRWWGKSLHAHRRSGERSTEEIDLVGTARNRVTVVGEARWTNRMMGLDILSDLETFKIPALAQDGLTITENLSIVLYSRSGYTTSLREHAHDNPNIDLVDVNAMLIPREALPRV